MKVLFKRYTAWILILFMIFSTFMLPKTAFAGSSINIRRIYPGEDVRNVSVESYFCFEFEEYIEEGRDFDKIEFKDSKGNHVAYEADITGNGIIIKPDSRLNYETNYTIKIVEGAVRDYKSPHDKNREYTYSFRTTANRTPLRIRNVSPSHRRRMDVKGEISIEFSKDIQTYYNYSNIVMKDSWGNDISIKADIKEDQIKIKPSKELEYNSTYYIYIPDSAVRDKLNEDHNNAVVLPIATAIDTNSPTVKSTTPRDNEKNFDLTKPIKVQFDKRIHKGYDYDKIKVLDADGGTIGRRLTIEGDTLIIEAYPLKYSATYTVKIPDEAVYNMGGEPDKLTNRKYSFTFTTSTDNTPVELKSSSILNGSKYIPIDTEINLTFTEPVTIPNNSNAQKGITLRDSRGEVPIIVRGTGDSLRIKLGDGINLAYNTSYTLNISTSAVKDYDGNQLKKNYAINFSTEPKSINPKLINADPQNGVENFNPLGTIKVRFSTSIKNGENYSDICIKDSNNRLVSCNKSIGGDILYITPAKVLDNNASYTYYIPAGALKDLNGNPQLQNYDLSFKTTGEKELPYILSVFPTDGSTNTAVDSDIIINMNKKVQQGVGFKNINLEKVRGDDIPITVNIKDDKLIIKPINNLNLEFDTSYKVYIPLDGIKDMNGSEMSKSVTFNFLTGNDRFCPVIVNKSNYDNAESIPIDKSIDLIFNDRVDKSDNFRDIKLLDSNNKKVDANISLWERNLSIKPLKNLISNSKYKIVVPENSVKDSYNNINKDMYELTFKTESEKNPPYILSTTPFNRSKDVDVNASFIMKFNEDIKLADSNGKGIKMLDFASRSIPFTINTSKNIITIKPKTMLQMNKNYIIVISKEAVKDMADNTMTGKDYIYTFTTISKERMVQKQLAEKRKQEQERKAKELRERIANDKTPPQVVNGGFSKDYKTITVIYSEEIYKGTDFRNIQVINLANGKKLPIAASIKGKNLIIKIKGTISKGVQYGLIVPSKGIKDIAGNTMQQDIKAGFVKPN